MMVKRRPEPSRSLNADVSTECSRPGDAVDCIPSSVFARATPLVRNAVPSLRRSEKVPVRESNETAK